MASCVVTLSKSRFERPARSRAKHRLPKRLLGLFADVDHEQTLLAQRPFYRFHVSGADVAGLYIAAGSLCCVGELHVCVGEYVSR